MNINSNIYICRVLSLQRWHFPEVSETKGVRVLRLKSTFHFNQKFLCFVMKPWFFPIISTKPYIYLPLISSGPFPSPSVTSRISYTIFVSFFRILYVIHALYCIQDPSVTTHISYTNIEWFYKILCEHRVVNNLLILYVTTHISYTNIEWWCRILYQIRELQ